MKSLLFCKQQFTERQQQRNIVKLNLRSKDINDPTQPKKNTGMEPSFNAIQIRVHSSGPIDTQICKYKQYNV